ncbi:MAG: hypothetical protein AB1813_26580 [Verrucomicrobiota bacterium]
MADELIPWARPHFQSGGGEAFLFFTIYGQFPSAIQVSAAAYRTTGLTDGIGLQKLARSKGHDFPFTRGAIGGLLRPQRPDLFEQLRAAPECLILQGTVFDPPDLNYLRNAIGLVMYFLENGGVAALDPQQFKIYDAESWREEIFAPHTPQWLNHVSVFASAENAETTHWLHTRGLRKFGRPDLSMRGIAPNMQPAVLELFIELMGWQIEGGLISEGELFRRRTLPESFRAHHGGSLDDPDFNNVHVELHPAKE